MALHLLSGPPPSNMTAKQVDFSKTSLPQYSGYYAVVIDNVLSPAECQAWIDASEATTEPKGTWERAMVNIGGGQQKMIEDIRNCGRIIWDSQDMVNRLWSRLATLPEVEAITKLKNMPHITGAGPAKRGEVWRFTRPNERMRFLKYVGGEYFRTHCDGVYTTPDGGERSYCTLHLYLNGRTSDDDAELVGGATRFSSFDETRFYDVDPRPGRVLLFQHRGLLHSGEDVTQGVKYTVRTDLMYAFDKMEPPTKMETVVQKLKQGTNK